MKKVLCTVLAVVMAVACFAGCSAPAAEGGNTAASGDTIKVGLLGPYTGKLAGLRPCRKERRHPLF